MTRKILSSVICLLLVASTVFAASCADDQNATNTNASNSQQDTNPDKTTPGDSSDLDDTIDPAMLSLNFSDDGAPIDLVFVYSESGETGESFTKRSIDPDDDSSDPVDVALNLRNSTIEDLYGVNIIEDKATDSIQGLQGEIGTQMQGKDPDIDVIVGYQYYDINMATQGWLVNLADMVDDYDDYKKVDYIKYKDKAYWGTDYIDALSYKDIVYWVTGDLSLRYVGGVYCTFINKPLYEQWLMPTYGSIYDIVEKGEWTLEKMYTMTETIWTDTNGNNEVDPDDVYGFGWEQNDCTDALAIASQVNFSSKSADGTTVTVTLNNTRTTTFVNELQKLLHGKNSINLGDQDSTIVMPAFAAGNCAFVINKVFKAESFLSDMDDDYYIVPVPKLDTNQKEYSTLIHDGCSIYGISYYSDAKSAAAATLEYMAYLSHKDVYSLYYDQALKSKYTNDESSAKMIDLIHENITTDFAVAWSASVNNIAHWFRTHNKTTGFARDLQRYQPSQQSALENLLKALEDYAESETA